LPPDKVLLDDFLRVLAKSIQLRGVYFREDGRKHAVEEAVVRLDAGVLNTPM
jgi:hypothetical protein